MSMSHGATTAAAVHQLPKCYSIAVFCGSKSGASPSYASAARALGAAIANRGFRLVYGGGSVGLMGEVAKAVAETADAVSRSTTTMSSSPCLGASASVIGVIPEALTEKEMSGDGVGTVEVVKDMHERKARMAEIADCFIAMPGGYGTMEELFEVVTWQQLGLHKKPVGVLNINGYYDSLLEFAAHAHNEGFVSDANKDIILNDSDPEKLIEKCLAYQAPEGAIAIAKRMKANGDTSKQ